MSADEEELNRKSPENDEEQSAPDQQVQFVGGRELGQIDYSFGAGVQGVDPPSTELAEPPSTEGLHFKTTEVKDGESAQLVSKDAPQDIHSQLVKAEESGQNASARNLDESGPQDENEFFEESSRSLRYPKSDASIHPDLASSTDIVLGQGAFVPTLIGASILAIGLQCTSPEASTAFQVAAVFGSPILMAGVAGYLNDQFWRKRASQVFASQKPTNQHVKFSRNFSQRALNYEATIPAIDEDDEPDVVRINTSSQTIELLPDSADARVFRDPGTGQVFLVEIDSQIDSGWRLWCRTKPLLGAGQLKDYWWVPKALSLYFVAAAVMMFVLFSQNNARADRAKSWPTTAGRITQVERMRHSSICRYSYTVSGKQYDSNRISMFARNSYRRYALGEEVSVHYDPRKPSRSVLFFDGDWYSLCWAMAMVGLAIFSFIASLASDFKRKGDG